MLLNSLLLICLVLPLVHALDPPEWPCDVRVWTRAPDLSPNTILPGEARLAINGTGCIDITNWSVGLKFKERAIIKIRNPEIPDFPIKPERPQYNESRIRSTRSDIDWNDIFTSSGASYSWNVDEGEPEYTTALDNYNLAIRNESLWLVEGRERVMFDLLQELPFEQVGTYERDIISPFHIHVPPTNFPPIDAYQLYGTGISGKEEQMLSTETVLEYYHNITLRNGTTLSLPAGKSSFLPASSPVHPVSQRSTTWPKSTNLYSDRLDEEFLDKEITRYVGPRSPACDKDNFAEFAVTVSSLTDPIVQGQNASLSLHITRSGNGSEYPTFIDINHALSRNITFAFPFLEGTNQTYHDLTSSQDESGQRSARSSRPLMTGSAQMLQAPSQPELERQRKERSTTGGRCFSFDGGRWPLGRNQVRKDIEEDDEMGREEWFWDVDLPISATDMPSFTKTFETLLSVIEIKLHTTFLCEDQPVASEEIRANFGRDSEWEEYSLPVLPNKKQSRGSGRSISHSGTIALDMRLSTSPSNTPIVHYMSANALSPYLSLSAEPTMPFAALDQTLRLETRAEQVKSRYITRQRNGRCRDDRAFDGCWSLNGGGAWMHVAKLWQGKVARELEEKVGVSTGRGKKGSGAGLVLQQ